MVALTEHPVVDVVLLVEDTALGSTCIQVLSTSFELGLDGINGEIYTVKHTRTTFLNSFDSSI